MAKNGISEYNALARMGFISLEEVEDAEATLILAGAGKEPKAFKMPKNKKARVDPKSITDAPAIQFQPAANQLPRWKEFSTLHPLIFHGLKKANYIEPTPIQKKVLQIVLKDGQRDILGSAPTGSGKTLSFLLPIVNYIASLPEDGLSTLAALIVVPTRELALQIKMHLEAVTGSIPQVQALNLIGGLSQERQERLLTYSPNIIVGTPGRVAEMIETHVPLQEQLEKLRFLVLDEADRLVEAGHFRDLETIFQYLFGKPNPSRQTFLFSATLAMRTKKDKGKGKSGLHQLRHKIQFNDPNPAVVSVGTKDSANPSNPAGLRHFKLPCLMEDKDVYLLFLLKSLPGRTLVFVNTIDLVRSLTKTLELLQVNAGALHAQMQQRQRMKSLERFRSGAKSVLITSDVAARGLDVPNVDCVIQYHIPKSQDVFVHRSGRTARGNKAGICIAMVAPHEQGLLDNISTVCKLTISDHEVDVLGAEACRAAVTIAQKIVKLEGSESKTQRQESWARKAAESMEIELEDDFFGKKRKFDDEDGDSSGNKSRNKQIANLKIQLSNFLRHL